MTYPNLDTSTTIVERDRWTVRQMQFDWQKVELLWKTISKFRTLFSDFTRGDFNNFLRFVTMSGTLWLEVMEDEALVGIIVCERLEQVVDCEAHVVFLDKPKDLVERVPLCKDVVSWLFATMPLQRITVCVPVIYYATVRLVRNIGFANEGRKRAAILIGGRWIDQYIFGMTRAEAVSL